MANFHSGQVGPERNAGLRPPLWVEEERRKGLAQEELAEMAPGLSPPQPRRTAVAAEISERQGPRPSPGSGLAATARRPQRTSRPAPGGGGRGCRHPRPPLRIARSDLR